MARGPVSGYPALQMQLVQHPEVCWQTVRVAIARLQTLKRSLQRPFYECNATVDVRRNESGLLGCA